MVGGVCVCVVGCVYGAVCVCLCVGGVCGGGCVCGGEGVWCEEREVQSPVLEGRTVWGGRHTQPHFPICNKEFLITAHIINSVKGSCH